MRLPETHLHIWLQSNFLKDTFYGINTPGLLVNGLTDFFNPATIMDFFFKDGFFTMITIQDCLNTPTRTHTLQLWNVAYNNVNSLIPMNSNLTLTLKSYNLQSIITSKLGSLSQALTEELFFLTSPKTDPFKIIETLPMHEDTLQVFEIISVNVDNSLYQYLHLPDTKMYYPEPFIASPSFNHEDLWFIHILHYQHWLWFFFISLILLFFITFINVVNWCNPRKKPKRETRGVSRSKCADLITACVPVSWAASIIISESVDAADYYDGFGTGEIVVGIRAYQWGWEYFFPKNIDLNYSINPTYSSVVGNSLKYDTSNAKTSESNQFWKNMHLNTNVENTSTPTHLILSPTDNKSILNFINFNDMGSNNLTASNSFRKIQNSTKATNHDLFQSSSDFSSKYNKINSLFLTKSNFEDSNLYGIKRQHEYTSLDSSNINNNMNLDSNSVDKLLSYNYTSPTVQGDDTRNTYKQTTYDFDNTRELDRIASREFNAKLNNSGNLTNPDLANMFDTSTVDYYSTTNHQTQNSIGSNISYKDAWLRSPNQQILSSERSVRNIEGLNPNKTNYNFNSTSTEGIINQSPTTLISNHQPTTFNNLNSLTTSFDISKVTGNPSTLMNAKDDLAPSFIFSPYWSTLWGNTSADLRIKHVWETNKLFSHLVVPKINEYNEYDFRNWQFIELLEDSLWESTLSGYSQEEYTSINLGLNKVNFNTEQDLIFTLGNRRWESLPGYINKPLLKDYLNISDFNTLPLYSEDAYLSLRKLNNTYVNLCDNELESDLSDNTYNSAKFFNTLYNLNYLNTLNMYSNTFKPFSYIQVLNSFRSSYEEPSYDVNTLTEAATGLDNVNLDEASTLRVSNNLRLRSTAKNAIVTFNALQKVFRPRFDEGRAHTRFSDLSNTYVKYPLVSEGRVSYEHLLGKNKESFFKSSSYKNFITKSYNGTTSLTSTLNTYFSNLPFLVSMKSDASRHMWFDWQSRWTSIEVQPSSVARYSLLGVPYFSKNFEYATKESDEFNDSETYMIRLSKARSNYMSNWSLTPYLYNRLNNWYNQNGFIGNLFSDFKVDNLRVSMVLTSKYWSSSDLVYPTLNATPSINDISTPNRSSIKPLSSVQGLGYNTSVLINILSKREYLYREYFLNKGYSVTIPNYLKASPTNQLLEEVKKSYDFVDPSTFLPEFDREVFYQKTVYNQFKLFNQLQGTLSDLNINSNTLSNLMYYTLDLESSNTLGSSTDIYKNQFRPMKKGISNMIRLHATGAIALPTEIRLHILASSRDIIHSWAIPSAGIKIDCVPGYSSHRVAIFLTTGIFYGSCMEICGRFHHWMPIIVYFMKRDLFFLWCTHFIHITADQTNLSTEFSSRLKTVSFTN